MTAATTRLHISPLTPETLPTVLGSTFAGSAQNISFHTIQTFPENSYGYLDLPIAHAQRLKKKLHGAVLKGRRMKVEDAKSKKRHLAETAEEVTVKTRKAKKPKNEHNAVDARELSPDRKIKRGWTEPKSEKVKKAKNKDVKHKSKAQAPSQFTEKEELLFKTRVPANRKAQKAVKKKTRKTSGDDIVHEFEKSTIQPSFLRNSTDAKASAEYVDGKGWVDNDGNIVEGEIESVSRKRKVGSKNLATPSSVQSTSNKPKAQLSESSSDDSDTSPSNQENPAVEEVAPTNSDRNEDTSSSGTSSADTSDSGSDSDAASPTQPQPQSSLETKKSKRKPDLTINPPTPLKSKVAITSSVPSKSTVHPLEALFKKPAKPAAHTRPQSDTVKPSLEVEGASTFSFFGNQDDDSDNEDSRPDSLSLAVPSTPFTMQDMRNREVRSAAPTPDTAHPSRFNSLHSSLTPDPMDLSDSLVPLKHIANADEGTSDDSSENDSDNENDGAEEVTTPVPISKKKQALSKSKQQEQQHGSSTIKRLEESEFEKRFWENRGENNRAWKAKRRTALKEKRQRENRSRRTKNW